MKYHLCMLHWEDRYAKPRWEDTYLGTMCTGYEPVEDGPCITWDGGFKFDYTNLRRTLEYKEPLKGGPPYGFDCLGVALPSEFFVE